MVGHLKVAYQNVCKSSTNAHTFLQWCWERKVDIVFIGEPWRSGEIKSSSFKDGTQLHDAYLLGAGETEIDMVVAYWRKKMAEEVKVLAAGNKEIWLKAGGVKIAGVYRRGEEGVPDLQEWTTSLESTARSGHRLALGDWNAHHTTWSLKDHSDRRGKYLHDVMQQEGFKLIQESKEPTFRRGDQVSRIDLVFATEGVVSQPVLEEWPSSDHAAILTTINIFFNPSTGQHEERKVVDKLSLEQLFKSMEKQERGQQEAWYRAIKGTSPYEKLKTLVAEHQRVIKLNERSKRWWDAELSGQIKKVTKEGRGGKGQESREHQVARWKRWKGEKTKLRWMIREKKRNCWHKFLKENGSKDPWDVVRLAKNPWGSKTRMKTLRNLDGSEIEEKEKAKALEKAHFLWDENREAEEEEEVGGVTGVEEEELRDKILDALSRTSNTSAPGPDGINYQLIKWANKTILGEYLISEVVDNLLEGRIPREWQNSKVVFIPKPKRDLTLLKAWRPITLINCIGKLGEKVVADELQEAGLLHKHQFGSVKGRSAIDAVFREVTRVQRCLSAGGKAGWGLWDVKGGFQNVKKEMVMTKLDETEGGRRWKSWISKFFRQRDFSIEWDGKVRGEGKTNVGVPQGSPLSPVVFLIYMAPILKDMEQHLSEATGLDIEVPSYVDDIMACVLDHDGVENIKEVLGEVDRIVGEVATRWNVPLEKEKHEKIVFNPKGVGSGRRKKRSEVERVKWLGIIVDDTLDFDHHWKSRIDKAKRLLGSLSSMGSSQWGISPTSWRQLYTGMIRVVALWGAELGWKGQKAWVKEFEKLQYQALRKCTGATLGASREKVNLMARVEDVQTILNSSQVRYLARCAADPSTTQDLWQATDAEKTGKGEDLAARLLKKAEVLSGDDISWGGTVQRFNLSEISLPCDSKTPPHVWDEYIAKTQRYPVYTDGSRSTEGVVGGGYFLQQGQLGIRVGKLATVWDGEITGMERGLKATANHDGKVIILADSKAAIQAVVNAGRRGKARTKSLCQLSAAISNWQVQHGPDNVAIGWVKSHIGIEGNERADEMAKMGSEKEGRDTATEGGLRQWEKERRRQVRVRKGYIDITKWHRGAASTYAQLRTNRGNLACWLEQIGKADFNLCRWCKVEPETGEHLVFKCRRWEFHRPLREVEEGVWRRWRTWEDLDLKVWIDEPVGEGGKEVNHVLDFFSMLPLEGARGGPQV